MFGHKKQKFTIWVTRVRFGYEDKYRVDTIAGPFPEVIGPGYGYIKVGHRLSRNLLSRRLAALDKDITFIVVDGTEEPDVHRAGAQ